MDLNWSKVFSKSMIIIESCKTTEWLLGKFPLGINFGPQSTTHSTKCWTTQRKIQVTLDKQLLLRRNLKTNFSCYIFYNSKYFLRKIYKPVKGMVVHILLIEMFIKHLAIKLCLLFLCVIGSKISSNHGLLNGGGVLFLTDLMT